MTEPKTVAVNPVTLEVKLDTRTIVLHKLPLKKYSDLLGALEKIPQILNTIDKKNTDEILQELPTLIKTSITDFQNVVSIGTSLSTEEIGELAADEVLNLILGIIEVNRYKEVYEKIKKVFAHQTSE